jgi:hypothetical protein
MCKQSAKRSVIFYAVSYIYMFSKIDYWLRAVKLLYLQHLINTIGLFILVALNYNLNQTICHQTIFHIIMLLICFAFSLTQ